MHSHNNQQRVAYVKKDVLYKTEDCVLVMYDDRVVKNFKSEMGKIREFINDAFKEELPPLGTPRPYIIPTDWAYIRQRTAKL